MLDAPGSDDVGYRKWEKMVRKERKTYVDRKEIQILSIIRDQMDNRQEIGGEKEEEGPWRR